MVSARTEPVRGDVSNQFAAVVMDHEGRFAVEVTIDGPAGPATVTAEVDATYDLRPPPFMLAIYALPFVLAGVPVDPPPRQETDCGRTSRMASDSLLLCSPRWWPADWRQVLPLGRTPSSRRSAASST